MVDSVIEKVLVAGAAANLGPAVLDALHRAGFHVSALSRLESKSSLPSYVTIKDTDYSKSSLATALKDQDAVVSLLPVTAAENQSQLIDAAALAGVRRFIPSEFGWDLEKPMLPALRDRMADKSNAIDLLKKTCSSGNGMSWTAIISGVYIDWALKKVPSLGFVLSEHRARIVGTGTEPVTGSTATDVGVAVAATLKNPEKTANRWLRIRSTQFNQNQLLEALKNIDQSEWTVENASIEDVEESRKQNISQGQFPRAFLDTLAIQLYEDGAGRGMVVEADNCDNELLGVRERSLDAVLGEIIT